MLDAQELGMAIELFKAQRNSEETVGISLSAFPEAVRKTMEVFDSGGDGMVDPHELLRAADLYVRVRRRSKLIAKIAVVIGFVFLGMFLALLGLAFAVLRGGGG